MLFFSIPLPYSSQTYVNLRYDIIVACVLDGCLVVANAEVYP